MAFFLILFYYLLINTFTFLLMSLDKKLAVKGKRRIPEKRLYLAAIFGGGFGGLIGMVVNHHKNRHIDIILVYTVTAILHILVAYLLIGKLAFGV